jgi:ATP-binding cassette subfamily B protein
VRAETTVHGQKRLISFARAIIATEIFILDEATSSIDTDLSLKSGRAEKLLRNRTSLSSPTDFPHQKCDRILVIDGEKIKEQGNHRQLMAARGRYYDLI